MNYLTNQLNLRIAMACAYLSADVYLPKSMIKNPIISDWNRLDEVTGNDLLSDKQKPGNKINEGFFARLYGNQQTGEAVVAYRGTDGHLGDFYADAHIPIGAWSDYDDNALTFFDDAKKQLRSKYIGIYSGFPTVTGHSLGGYLAQIVGYQNKFSILCIAFNAPNIVGLKLPDGNKITNQNLPNLFSVSTDSDPIHTTSGGRIGNVHSIPGYAACSAGVYNFQKSGHVYSSESAMIALTGHTKMVNGTAHYDNGTSVFSVHCSMAMDHAMLTAIEQLKENPDILNNIEKNIAAEKSKLDITQKAAL